MKSKGKKLLIMGGFVFVFGGAAIFMYFSFIHNKPRMKFDTPRTDVDPRKVDSVLYEMNKDKKLK